MSIINKIYSNSDIFSVGKEQLFTELTNEQAVTLVGRFYKKTCLDKYKKEIRNCKKRKGIGNGLCLIFAGIRYSVCIWLE